MIRRILHMVNEAILLAVQETPGWLRPFHYIGWWVCVGWKVPMVAYRMHREGFDQSG